MRKGPLSAVLAGTLVLASVPVLTASLRRDAPQPPATQQQGCTAPASWFPTTAQPVNFQVGDNCSFHQWAWQEFLWLTQGASGGTGTPNFMGFADPIDLFVPNPPPYPGRSTTGELLEFMPRDRKDDETINIDAISQAGTNNILIDGSGHPVYYIIQIDSTWYNFARSNGYNQLARRLAAPDTQNFPVVGPGTIELKSSWRVAQVGDSVLIPNAATRFVTTRANIAPVSVSGGKFVVDTANPVQATMALVGMHVVGTVPNHPEFIWATFEHVDNAPTCAGTPAGNTNPSTGQPWSLYTGNGNCRSSFGPCNKGQGVSGASFRPTPVCQLNPWGDTSSTSPNAQNIQSINASVAAQLPASRALMRNYVLVGGQWTFPGGLPAITTRGQPTNIRGSSKLANTSMESFTQLTNCFGCHNPTPSSGDFNAKNIAVSHVWPLPPTMKQNRVTAAPARPAEFAGARR
jgi:hypothetical protein